MPAKAVTPNLEDHFLALVGKEHMLRIIQNPGHHMSAGPGARLGYLLQEFYKGPLGLFLNWLERANLSFILNDVEQVRLLLLETGNTSKADPLRSHRIELIINWIGAEAWKSLIQTRDQLHSILDITCLPPGSRETLLTLLGEEKLRNLIKGIAGLYQILKTADVHRNNDGMLYFFRDRPELCEAIILNGNRSITKLIASIDVLRLTGLYSNLLLLINKAYGARRAANPTKHTGACGLFGTFSRGNQAASKCRAG